MRSLNWPSWKKIKKIRAAMSIPRRLVRRRSNGGKVIGRAAASTKTKRRMRCDS
jgi:hypothetical protein